MIERGPTPTIHSVVRWRITGLGQWLWEKFEASVSPQTLSRVLRGMGLRKLSTRPKLHAKAEGAIAAFKKVPCHAGRYRAGPGPQARGTRDLVLG